MGGTEGARGYLYQGIASIIRALSNPDWDTIYVEYPSSNDKVDIALEKDGVLIKSIQVKSTIDSFSKGNLTDWMVALTSDGPADSYEIFIIGNCADSAQKIKKSIYKYNKNEIDSEVNTVISELPKNLPIEKISIDVLPYDMGHLDKIVIAELHENLSDRVLLKYDQLSFLKSSLIADHMSLSTTQAGCKREIFEKTLQTRIEMLVKNYSPKRIPINVVSFVRGVPLNDNEQYTLNLLDMFDGRLLKPEYNWNTDMTERIKSFFSSCIDENEAYELHLDAHYAISFLIGRVFDNKSGVNMVPAQKSPNKLLWDYDPLDTFEYPKLNIKHQELSKDLVDTALILNISRDIYHDVIDYIDSTKLNIGRIINCTPSLGNSNSFSVINGTHCAQLANSIYSSLCQRTIPERRATLHIFAAVPNAFMFYLGQVSRPFGNTVIYDFDFDLLNSCTYFPTICFQGGK